MMKTRVVHIQEDTNPASWNDLVSHPMQSWEWGAIRKTEGREIVRFVEYKDELPQSAYLMTIHPLPGLPLSIGYIPKSIIPSHSAISFLKDYARAHHLMFIKCEPFAIKGHEVFDRLQDFKVSPHPLFTQWNQILDISCSEEQLLNHMHHKTRYNIRLAEKKGVTVHEMSTDAGYEIFENFYFDTCARQKYRGHTKEYHRNIWHMLHSPNPFNAEGKNHLTSYILVSFYKEKPLGAFQLWKFKDTMYYVYGGSSDENKNVMAPNALMWEAIRFAKQLGCTRFDMWGSLPPDFDPSDPWAGFTRFKQGYGTNFVEYVGSFDLVINKLEYSLYSFAHSFRAKFL